MFFNQDNVKESYFFTDYSHPFCSYKKLWQYHPVKQENKNQDQCNTNQEGDFR